MADGYLLSAASIRQLQADHRALRAAITRLERQLSPSTNNPPDFGRETWWGVTVQRDGEDYPDGTGDTYGVQLLSLYYDQTSTGSIACTADVADPGRIVVARTVTGCNLPEGSTVIVERRQTKLGVEHWIRPPYATIRRFVAVDSIAAGSSGTVTLKVYGLPDENVEAYYDWADAGGGTIAASDEGFCYWAEEQNRWRVLPHGGGGTTRRDRCVIVGARNWDNFSYAWRDGDGGTSSVAPAIGNNGTNTKDVRLFPGVEGSLSNDEGTVFSVNDTPAAFADDWLTIEQDGLYRVIWTGTWFMSGISLSDAQTLLRAAQHRHMDSTTGMTSFESPDATSLEHQVCGIKASLDNSTGNVFETYSSLDLFHVYNQSGTGGIYGKYTLIAHFLRSGTDVYVTPLLQQSDSAPNAARRIHIDCYITVEQISDS